MPIPVASSRPTSVGASAAACASACARAARPAPRRADRAYSLTSRNSLDQLLHLRVAGLHEARPDLRPRSGSPGSAGRPRRRASFSSRSTSDRLRSARVGGGVAAEDLHQPVALARSGPCRSPAASSGAGSPAGGPSARGRCPSWRKRTYWSALRRAQALVARVDVDVGELGAVVEVVAGRRRCTRSRSRSPPARSP